MSVAPKRNWLSALSMKAQAMLAVMAGKHGVGETVQFAEQLLRASIRPTRRRRIGWSAKSDQANRKQRRVRLAPATGPGSYAAYDARVRELLGSTRYAARMALKEFRA